MRGMDIIGNIAVVKFKREDDFRDKKKFALSLLKEWKSISTVLEKINKFRGRLRTQKTKWLAGKKTKEASYKENGCVFKLNIDTCYFSPRLASERLSVAKMIKKGEEVLVMFGGIAPYAVVIGKNSKARKIVSIEIGKNCNKYALENIKKNKLESMVKIIGGDVKKKVPELKKKFDRIVMARPNLKNSFLDVAFKKIKKRGIIHYYGFYFERDVEKLKELILEEAKKARKRIKILGIKRAGEIGVQKYRYRADIKIY